MGKNNGELAVIYLFFSLPLLDVIDTNQAREDSGNACHPGKRLPFFTVPSETPVTTLYRWLTGRLLDNPVRWLLRRLSNYRDRWFCFRYNLSSPLKMAYAAPMRNLLLTAGRVPVQSQGTVDRAIALQSGRNRPFLRWDAEFSVYCHK